MSTNSRIGIIRSDGSVDSIYCHWDGYYEHNGKILFSEYQDLNKINRLIELGSISFNEEYVYLYDENASKWLTMSAYAKDMLVSLEEKLKELDLIEEPVQEMGGIKNG